MKKCAILLMALWMSGTLNAQTSQPAATDQPSPDGQTVQTSGIPQTAQAAPAPNSMQRRPQTSGIMAKPERYLYAELIGSHLPSYRGDGVIFDFGQTTGAWSYNWLTDEQGRKIRFDSMVEALNYMLRQRWEFVQAYTSGKDNEKTHYLLRIRTEEIPDLLRIQLPSTPDGSDFAPEESAEEPAPAHTEQPAGSER